MILVVLYYNENYVSRVRNFVFIQYFEGFFFIGDNFIVGFFF